MKLQKKILKNQTDFTCVTLFVAMGQARKNVQQKKKEKTLEEIKHDQDRESTKVLFVCILHAPKNTVLSG